MSDRPDRPYDWYKYAIQLEDFIIQKDEHVSMLVRQLNVQRDTIAKLEAELSESGCSHKYV